MFIKQIIYLTLKISSNVYRCEVISSTAIIAHSSGFLEVLVLLLKTLSVALSFSFLTSRCMLFGQHEFTVNSKFIYEKYVILD